MKIAFVVPAYNEEALIGRCLESILRELARGDYDSDVVVVNNASTDRTAEIARGFPGVRVVDEPVKGLVKARQAGYVATDGELIANVDGDCALTPGWIDTVLTEFGKDERMVALSGPFIYDDLPLRQRALTRTWYGATYCMYVLDKYVLGVGGMLQGGNFIVRRSAMEKIGGFDTSIEFYGEDTDIARRISKAGRLKWTFALPMYSSGRRVTGEGFVRTGLRYAANYFAVNFGGRPVTRTHRDLRPENDNVRPEPVAARKRMKK
ncbi:MAG: glycosyltransferase family A protein [Bauldia litoralis]